MSDGQRHFRIGVVGVTLRGAAEVLELYARTYAPFETGAMAPDALVFDIVAGTPHRRRERYRVIHDGEVHGEDLTPPSAVAEIDALLNQLVIRHLNQYVQLHAASLSWQGEGVLFPADSGTGKSTLAAALVDRGWQYLSDEFAMIEPRTLQVHALPKALCVKEPGRHLVRGPLAAHTAEPFILRGKYRRYYIPPWTLGRQVIGTACPVRWMFFLSRKPGTTPRLVEPTASEAVIYTYRTGLNTLNCGHSGLATTVALVRQSRCYQLNVGGLDETCDVIEQALGRVRSSDRASA